MVSYIKHQLAGVETKLYIRHLDHAKPVGQTDLTPNEESMVGISRV